MDLINQSVTMKLPELFEALKKNVQTQKPEAAEAAVAEVLAAAVEPRWCWSRRSRWSPGGGASSGGNGTASPGGDSGGSADAGASDSGSDLVRFRIDSGKGISGLGYFVPSRSRSYKKKKKKKKKKSINPQASRRPKR